MADVLNFREKEGELVDLNEYRLKHRKISDKNYRPTVETPKPEPTAGQRIVEVLKKVFHLDGIDMNLSDYGNAPAGMMNEISRMPTPIRPPQPPELEAALPASDKAPDYNQ